LATESLNILHLHRDADQARRVEEYILRASGGRARVESAVIQKEIADLAFQERPQVVILSMDKLGQRDLAYVSDLVEKIPSAALVVLAGRADPCQAARIREAGALECLIGESLGSDRLWPAMSAAQAEQAEFGEGLYRSIVENQSDLICRFSADGVITFVNRAFCEFFGQPAVGLTRIPFPDLVAPQDRSLLLDPLLGLDPESPLTRVELRCNSSRRLAWSTCRKAAVTCAAVCSISQLVGSPEAAGGRGERAARPLGCRRG
jgi:PAS domain-containing protein